MAIKLIKWYIYIYIVREREREDVKEKAHTHASEFLLQLGHVLAVGDPEVVVGIVSLRDAVGRSGSANG
jgi:hypothetical protein